MTSLISPTNSSFYGSGQEAVGNQLTSSPHTHQSHWMATPPCTTPHNNTHPLTSIYHTYCMGHWGHGCHPGRVWSFCSEFLLQHLCSCMARGGEGWSRRTQPSTSPSITLVKGRGGFRFRFWMQLCNVFTAAETGSYQHQTQGIPGKCVNNSVHKDIKLSFCKSAPRISIPACT